MYGLGFWCSGFGFLGIAFGVQSLGFGVQDEGFGLITSGLPNHAGLFADSLVDVSPLLYASSFGCAVCCNHCKTRHAELLSICKPKA